MSGLPVIEPARHGSGPSVVIVTDDWKGAGGGVETFLTNLVDAMKVQGVDPVVLFQKGSDPSNVRVEGSGMVFALRTYRVLSRLRPEVVHCHGTWFCMLGSYLYGQLNDARLVNTFHTQPIRPLGRFGREMLRRFVGRFDHLTYVSGALERSFSDMYGLEHHSSEVLTAGVRAKGVEQAEIDQFRQLYGLGDNDIVILGQALTANKMKAEGAKVLMEAVHGLRERFPGIVLVLTREGMFSDELREFASERKINNVIFTGDVSNPFVPLVLCRVLAHITLGDGLPMSVLEAMSVGKPIVATPVGGIPEVIVDDETGLLVGPTVEKVAPALERLLSDQETARRLGENARTFVASRMTWERTAARFIAIYNGTD